MKKIIKKNYLFASIIFSGILLLSACSDFLDREPLGRVTQDDLASGSFETQVFGLYAGLRAEGICGLQYLAVHSIRSDDADKGSTLTDGADAEKIYDNFEYVKDHWLMNQYWTGHYTLINLCNNVIADIDSVKATDQPTLINKAEAKFMRAYTYFDLVRAFGEVPKIDFKIRTAAEGNIPKSSVADIYALIDADLQEAANTLPLSWEFKYIGRLTSGAAKSLQAKTYLTRKNWTSAFASAQEVISSNIYNLNTPYNKIFREEGENTSESIFEIQAYYDQTNNYGITYSSRQGVRGSGDWNLGWGYNTPNQLLADAFEPGDPRKDETLLYSGKVNTPYGEIPPAATANLPREYWNKKSYSNPAIRRSVNSNGGSWVDMRVIRYADLVLMAAEAANESGNSADALKYLEMIRARARQNNSAILPKVTTTNQAELRDAIRHERRVELGMEHDRFFDLVRWEIDVEVLHAAGKTNYQTKHRFLPIPQPEIDKSNGVLIQNPNY